jgi:alpha-beta hydrolase superfamily lysophospholipase
VTSTSPIRRYELPVPGAAAEALFRRGWVPEAPRATVLLVHGFAEHSGRYEHVGRWLAERGYATHAYDHLGHGRSSGERCHVERFDQYLDDLGLVLEQVRKDAPAFPVFLVGHSMGGLIVASYAVERRPDVLGIVLSGAALAVPRGRARFQLWLARGIRAVAPRLAMGSGLDLDGLASDPRVLEAYLADQLVERKLTVSLAAELMTTVERTAPRGGAVSVPLLALHGAEDTLTSPSGSEQFAAAAPRGRSIVYPGLRHEIFNEPSYEQVLGEVASFFDGLLADRPDPV